MLCRYNVGVRFGPRPVYVIYHTPLDAAAAVAQLSSSAAAADPSPITRTLLCEVPTPRPCYMHSFAMSRDHIVLSESPVHIDLLRMLAAPITGTATALAIFSTCKRYPCSISLPLTLPFSFLPLLLVLQAPPSPNPSFSTPAAPAASL